MLHKSLTDAGVGVEHHFAAGVYAKETHIPAGVVLSQHVHSHDHLSVLASGTVAVSIDGGIVEQITGPACLTIKAGVAHSVIAITKAVWFCIHATDETDPDKVDAELIA